MALYDLENRTRAFGAVRRWRGQDGRWYSDTHKGDDYAETYGNDPFPAIQPGKVIAKFRSSTFGNLLWVRRDPHVVVKYHMLDEPSPFEQGDTIKPGDIVGRTGASADNASGNHGHLQVEVDGLPVSPRPYITGSAAGTTSSSFDNQEDELSDKAEQQIDAIWRWIRGDGPDAAGTLIYQIKKDTSEIVKGTREMDAPDTRNRIGNLQYAMGLLLERDGKAPEFMGELDDAELQAIAKTVNDERDRRERERLGK